MVEYESDTERYPFAPNWIEATTYYSKSPDLYTCTVVKNDLHAKYGYAYNSILSGAREPANPEATVLIYDSANLVRDAADPVTSLPTNGRHHGKNLIAFADGHVRSLAPVGAPPR